ncbi:hypothetical protein Pmani_024978 [Petrolisthes manimaculis]|uniref:Uncharacterized protein n=1 Tax=Petrolisthes manimaculis TaxID=1843537 RepID=A0AAE1P8W4_9EUCA|nr:hypothetical protein Pmani_024978 [Petrolisthes manimaculis]
MTLGWSAGGRGGGGGSVYFEQWSGEVVCCYSEDTSPTNPHYHTNPASNNGSNTWDPSERSASRSNMRRPPCTPSTVHLKILSLQDMERVGSPRPGLVRTTPVTW